MSPVYGSMSWLQPAPWRVARSAESDVQASPSPKNTEGSSHPEYIAFVLVPVFFVMGLLGVLICHILKKKGYRCTTEAEHAEMEKVAAESIEMNESIVDSNNDTVGQIVNYIMKNEANADVLKAMVADSSMIGDTSVFDPESPTTPNTPGSPTTPNSPMSPTTPYSPTSPSGTPSKHTCRGNHFHTVGGVAEKCTRCTNKRWHLIKSPPKHKEPRKPRQAVTVLSVGRFRVTKVEPKSKERKRLMSGGTEVKNGEVPATPNTRQRSGTESENQITVET
ncbi:RELT-like protein 1 [Discoglossus pictus]